MLIIRTTGKFFENLLPIIKEQEAKGFKYIRDEDDQGMWGQYAWTYKRIYFDDLKDEVTYENRTKHME